MTAPRPRLPAWWRTVLRVTVAAAVVALAVVYAWKQDWRAVWATLRHADALLLLVAATLNVPLVLCKARRSQLLLSPTVRLPLRRLMRIFFASYAADNLLMSHAGVGLRVALVRQAGATWATSAAVQALEKALEAMGVAWVALLVELSAPAGHPWPRWVDQPLRVVFWLAASSAGVAVVMVLIDRFGGHPPGPRLAGGARFAFVRRLGDAAVALRRPRALVEVLLVSAAAWGVEVLMVLVTLRALSLPSSVGLAALVVLAVTVAALIPGLPANVGPFEASVIIALEAGGVGKAAALGLALAYHLLHTLPVTAIGLPDLRRAGWRPVAAETATAPDPIARTRATG